MLGTTLGATATHVLILDAASVDRNVARLRGHLTDVGGSYLVVHGIGACAVDDFAVSVVATVIGQRSGNGWILVDTGWMAMSRDRGTRRLRADRGYGLVCDVDGTPCAHLIVADASPEHGIVTMRAGSKAPPPELPIGKRVRILPDRAWADLCGGDHIYARCPPMRHPTCSRSETA